MGPCAKIEGRLILSSIKLLWRLTNNLRQKSTLSSVIDCRLSYVSMDPLVRKIGCIMRDLVQLYGRALGFWKRKKESLRRTVYFVSKIYKTVDNLPFLFGFFFVF